MSLDTYKVLKPRDSFIIEFTTIQITSHFPCRFHSTGAPLIVKKIGKKKLLILIIFIGVAQKALRLWCEGPSS
jgi:hypothetical protein